MEKNTIALQTTSPDLMAAVGKNIIVRQCQVSFDAMLTPDIMDDPDVYAEIIAFGPEVKELNPRWESFNMCCFKKGVARKFKYHPEYFVLNYLDVMGLFKN